MAFRATRTLRYAGERIAVEKKYTVHSTGIWERVRKFFALDPARSSGVPLNQQFRNPPPGALKPQSYDDPVTIPAGDIADNPYWKRDNRRSYPQRSVVNQGQAVGLLTFGSERKPIEGKLGLGEEGSKQLVAVEKEGEEKGLAGFFKGEGQVQAILGPDGLPPRPTPLNAQSASGDKEWTLIREDEQAYPSSYPCRTFI